MSKLMRKTVLLAKKETTKGTDAIPTGPLNAIRAQVSSITPLEAEHVQRDDIGSTFGADGEIFVGGYSKVTFRVELAGSGTAGTAPALYPLLEMCGFAPPEIVAVTSVTAKLITDAIPSNTIYWYLDGLQHKMLGCMANAKITMDAKQIPYIELDVWGLYTAPTDTLLPSDADYSAFLAPVGVNKVNTPSWSIHGVSGISFSSLNFDLGNQLVYINEPGREEIDIRNRRVTGSITMEMTPVATKAWHEQVRTNVLDAFALTHGTVAGNIADLTAPKAQLLAPSYPEVEGEARLGLNLLLTKDAGNDELQIAWT